MRIIEIIYSLGNGGAERFTVELSNELAKTNAVTLCSVRAVEKCMLPPRKLSGVVDLIELDFDKKYSFDLICKLFHLLKKTKPDVVHLHSSILVLYFYFFYLFFRKTVFLQTVHSTITPSYSRLFKFLAMFRFLNPGFINVCISKSIFEEFKSTFPKLRFVHIDNGIERVALTDKYELVRNEIAGLKKDKSAKVFIAIGNYSVFKNFTMLAEVFKEFEKTGLDAILLLLGGNGSNGQNKFSEVAQIKGENTFQLGMKDNVADYLFCSDALLMSSTKEGMPLVVLEAMSIGLPVISTPAGGVVDIVENGVNGIIAKGFEKKDLIEAINVFLNLTEGQIRKIKENNQKNIAERFTIATCADHYLRLAYSVH